MENYLIVSEEFFNRISAKSNIPFIYIFYKSNNANKLQDDIDEVLKNESYNLNNLEENVKMMNDLFTLVGIFLYGFIIVISLIGINFADKTLLC